jgi:hypothetical protein
MHLLTFNAVAYIPNTLHRFLTGSISEHLKTANAIDANAVHIRSDLGPALGDHRVYPVINSYGFDSLLFITMNEE